MSSLNKLKNPFSQLTDEKWKKYANDLEPFFTEEPYYEVVPWSQIKSRIEDTAKEAGFEMVLRTTNNKAYCPDHFDDEWIQKTQWLFGYKGKKIFFHITYTEEKAKDGKWQNFVSIHAHLELPVEEIDVTEDYKTHMHNFVEEDDDGQFKYETVIKKKDRYIALVYKQPCPPNGYISNGGMVMAGLTEYYYTKVFDFETNDEKKICVLERDITPTFFSEWLEKNQVLDGKIETIYNCGYSYSLNFFFGKSSVLRFLMDFLFLKKLLKSNIEEFITKPWSRECTFEISDAVWKSFGKTKNTCSVLEGKIGFIWYPVYNRMFQRKVTDFEKLRLTSELQSLIDKEMSGLSIY